ncbi:MAG: ABC transporter permease [Elusimicrobia bacterium]|nr:ABC transporter permease [Elusimicrobiota bacterium]
MRMLWLSLRTGFVELWEHKTRSFLSLLSVAIGAGVFLSSFSSIYDAHCRVRKSLELSGEGRFSLRSSYARSAEEKSVILTMGDLRAISAAMPWLYMIYPIDVSWQKMSFDGASSFYAGVAGITPDWRKRDWQYRLEGRFIDDYDVENASKVCLLILPGQLSGEDRAMRKAFMKNWSRWSGFDKYVSRNTVTPGSKVKMGRYELTVVGLLHEPPQEEDYRFRMGAQFDAVMPITTFNDMLSQDQNNVGQIVIDAGPARKVEQAKRIAQVALESRHGPIKELECEDFREVLSLQMARTVKEAMSTLALGLAALLAGGIGIMNVTLAIVFSRIKEIGIRRAIGATRGEIIMQFLTETLLLGFFGGIIGIVLGYYGVGNILLGDFSHTSKLTWWMPLISIAVAMAACLMFSLLPAYRAARLDPVEALRTE